MARTSSSRGWFVVCGVLCFAGSAAAQSGPLPTAPAPSWTGEAAAAGGGRWALVIVADKHAADPSLDLAEGKRAVERLTGALGQGLGVAGDRLRLLTGAQVTEAAVEREVERLAGAVRGPDNLLLVYYIGHGWTRAGALELFTHDTKRQGDLFERTLPHAKLCTQLGGLRQAVEKAGGALRVACVIDACRPRTKAPPGPVTYTPSELDVELFAASEGQLASEGVFVEGFCDALMDQGKRERTVLGDVLDQTARVVKEKTGGAQAPQLARGERALVLRQQGDLSLGLEAWDPIGKGKRIEGAKITFAGRDATSPASFAGLRPGRYAWQVDAPGYFWRTGEVELTRERSGQTLRVALLPDLVLVTGEVLNPSGTVVRARLAGARPAGTIDDYHLLESTVIGSGAFFLKLPSLQQDAEVVVEIGGAELARLRVALGAGSYVVQGDLRAPHRHLGRLDLGQRAQARRLEDLAIAATVEGAIALPELQFADDRARATYEQLVKKPATRGGAADLRQALAAASAITSRVLPGSQAGFDDLRARLTLEVSRLRRPSEPAPAREDLVASLGSAGRGNAAAAAREQAVRWLIEDGRALAGKDQAGATDLLDRAVALAPDGGLRGVARLEQERAWVRRVELAVAKALEDDLWDAPRAALAEATSAVGAGPLAAVKSSIDREGLPKAARERLARAHRAYGDGRLEEAEREYEAVRPECNTFHAAVVAKQLEDISGRLFQRYLAEADQRRVAGDLRGTASALERARRYDPTLIDSLLADLPLAARTFDEHALVEAANEGNIEAAARLMAVGHYNALARINPMAPVIAAWKERADAVDGLSAAQVYGRLLYSWAQRHPELGADRVSELKLQGRTLVESGTLDHPAIQDLLASAYREVVPKDADKAAALEQGLFERYIRHAEKSQDVLVKAQTLYAAGSIGARSNSWERATEVFEQSARLRAKADDKWGQAWALAGQAFTLRPDNNPGGSWPQAVALIDQAVLLMAELDSKSEQGALLHEKAECLQPNMNKAGSWDQAGALYERAATLRGEAGDKRGEGESLYKQAYCSLPGRSPAGSWDRAAALFERAAALRGESGDRSGQSDSLVSQAWCLEPARNTAGSWDRAVALYERAAALRGETGDKKGQGACLHDVASE